MQKRILYVIIMLMTLVGCSPKQPAPSAPEPTQAVVAAPPTLAPRAPTAAPQATAAAAQPTPAAAVDNAPVALAAYGPADFPSNVNPLTGREVSDPQLLERRPVAVKVQMFPRGQRPPWGVSLADIVYDYYNNFGLTRFHAIFLGQNAEQVGPIRSARLLDIDLINMYRSVFAFGSAEQRTYSKLVSQSFYKQLVLEGNNKCPPMCRIEPESNNYLVANTSGLGQVAVEQGAENARQNLDGMKFDPVTPANGQSGTQITVRHSISAYSRWDYDAATGRYLRFQDTQEANDQASETFEPLIDRLTNQQIATDNVVVIVVGHKYAFGTKSGPNEVIEIGLEGTGPAYAFRDGQVYQLNWVRATTESVMTLQYSDGTPYPFKPGSTWFELVGKSSTITPSGSAYRFQHTIP